MIPDRRRALLALARAVARGSEASRRIEPVPAAAGRRGDRLVGPAVHAGLYLAVAAAVAGFFSPLFGESARAEGARIAIGVVLAAEGGLLATDRRGARRLLLRRLYARSTRHGAAPASLVETLRWRLLGPLLAVLALVAFCAGLILVGQAVDALV